jgi:hypothetical protein
MNDASVCFWETPLPLDVEPRLLLLPKRHSGVCVCVCVCVCVFYQYNRVRKRERE